MATRTEPYLEIKKVEGVEDIISTRAATFYDYWRSRHQQQGNVLPRWSNIDLMAIHALAPFITIKDVVEGGKEFRNRYWGTGLARVYGFDATGRTFSDYLSKEAAEEGNALHRKVVETAQPWRSTGTMRFWQSKAHIGFEGIICPLLGDNGETVEMVMSYYDIDLGDD